MTIPRRPRGGEEEEGEEEEWMGTGTIAADT